MRGGSGKGKGQANKREGHTETQIQRADRTNKAETKQTERKQHFSKQSSCFSLQTCEGPISTPPMWCASDAKGWEYWLPEGPAEWNRAWVRPADEPKRAGRELLFNLENDIQEGGLSSPGREQWGFQS